MSQLIRLKDIQATHRDLIGDDYYDPTDKTAYGVNEEKIGKIEELDIDNDGNVVDREGNLVNRDDITADDVRRARGM